MLIADNACSYVNEFFLALAETIARILLGKKIGWATFSYISLWFG